MKEELEKINEKKDEAVYGGKFLEASILRDEINTLKEKLDYLEKQKNEKESKNSYVLGYDEIAAVISEMSKIPVSKLKQDESKKYINLNKDLNWWGGSLFRVGVHSSIMLPGTLLMSGSIF